MAILLTDVMQFDEDDGLTEDMMPLSCLECGKGFMHAKDLEEHTQQHEMFPKFDMERKLKLFGCDHCNMSFPFKRYLDQHIQNVHSEIKLPFSCHFCGKTFAKQIYLDNHARGHLEKMHKCNLCDKAFVRISLLKRHLTSHAEERPHKCTECAKTFRDSFDLKRHYRLHTGEKPFTCDFCGKGFPQKISLMFHLKVHTGDMPYKCNVCTKSFRRPNSLRNHKQIHYAMSESNKNKPFVCLDCGLSLTNFSEFEAHIETHNTNSNSSSSSSCDKENSEELDFKPLLCIYCGECFKLFEDYEKHVLNHENNNKSNILKDESKIDSLKNEETKISDKIVSNENSVISMLSASGSEDDGKIYSCQECGCGFKSKSSCNRHIQMAHQEFICEICNKLFQNLKLFQEHLPMHSQYLKENVDKPNAVYSCPHCGSNFSCKDKYETHVASHDSGNLHQCEFCDSCFINFEHLQTHRSLHLTDKKAYQCDLCDKSFVRHSTLFNHLQQHANSPFYKCKACGKCFTASDELDQHTRIHRGEVPYKCLDCGVGFYTSYKLKEHRVVHSDKNELVCPECGVGFATNKQFDRHKKLHDMGNICEDGWSDDEWYHQN